MRVTAGSARGIELRTPQGWHGRPTTDRVRGAMFSMLEAREAVKDRRVLDLFAGTGALGIEALSRGAASTVCVERGARECATIRENAKRAGVADNLTVLAMPVARGIRSLEGPFDLVFMDPPYDDSEIIPTTLEFLLAADDLLHDDAIIVVEQSSRNPTDLGGLAIEDSATRRYGDTLVSLLKRRVPAGSDSGEMMA